MIKFTSKPANVYFINKDKMPSDGYIVNSALVENNYQNFVDIPQAKFKSLFNEMIDSGHWGCLDHAAPTMYVHCPIFVARQIMRASNASFNEKSGRYGKIEPVFYVPQNIYTDVKRKELDKDPEIYSNSNLVRELLKTSYTNNYTDYQILLEKGIRKEQARQILPTAIFTSFWMTLKLSDWLHFLHLRLDPHAQYETRYTANLIYEHLKSQFPFIIERWRKNTEGRTQTP